MTDMQETNTPVVKPKRTYKKRNVTKPLGRPKKSALKPVQGPSFGITAEQLGILRFIVNSGLSPDTKVLALQALLK